MEVDPVFAPIEPALEGRYLALTSQGIPAEIAAADMLGTLQEACFELPADSQPTMRAIIDTVKATIAAARHKQHAAAMS